MEWDWTTTCTATAAGTATVAFTTATTSTTILRVSATGAIATGTFVLTCSSNIAVNGAVGAVTFDIVSTKDTSALTGQTGYTIIDLVTQPHQHGHLQNAASTKVVITL